MATKWITNYGSSSSICPEMFGIRIRRKWIYYLLIIVIIAFVLTTGCSSDQKNTDAANKTENIAENGNTSVIPSPEIESVKNITKEPIQTDVIIPGTTTTLTVVSIDSKGEADWIQKKFVYTPEGWSIVGSCDTSWCRAQIQARDEFSFIQVFRDQKINYDMLLAINQSPIDRSLAHGTYAILSATRDDTQYIINGINARHAILKIENDVTREQTDGDLYIFEDGIIMIYYHRLSADYRDIANSRKIMETYHGLKN
jgi:hypothetical protein